MGSPTATQHQQKKARKGRPLLLGCLSFVGILIVGFLLIAVFVPETFQLPTLLGVLILDTALVIASGGSNRWRISWLIFGVLFAAGATFTAAGPSRPYGPIVLLLMVALLPVLGTAAFAEDRARVRVRTYLARLGIGLALAGLALGWLKAMASPGGFAIRYGRTVTAHLDGDCVEVDRGELPVDIYCRGTWSIDGTHYSGNVHFGSHLVGNDGVEAHVIPGRRDAYTADSWRTNTDGLEVYGLVPWWVIVPAVLLLVGAIVAAIRDGRPPKRVTPGSFPPGPRAPDRR